MIQPSSLFVVDADVRSLETLTFGFEREGCKVTGTSDLNRAPLLVRSAPHDVAVVSLREPERSWLELVAALHGAAENLPIIVLGPQALKAEALRAGAADFLTLPIFLRDVIGLGRLRTFGGSAKDDKEGEIQTRLSEHYGLFYVLRAVASSERSGIIALTRGNRRAELRIHEGTVVSASVGAMQGLPALHHMLLWEEAALSLTHRTISKRSQLHLSTQEILNACERFLRDFAHAARDLGAPRTVYVAVGVAANAMRGVQSSQVTPLLRLFDGRRVLADVIEESPFRIFDTVRMIRRLRDSGTIVAKHDEARPDRSDRRDPRMGAAPSPPPNGAPKSMLSQWAMAPDQRGVVGDRRATSRRLRPIGPLIAASGPASGPAPASAPAQTTAPIPLVAKKVISASGELAVAKRSPTPLAAAALAVAPTVQVQLDPEGVPVGEPRAPAALASLPAQASEPPIRARGGSGRHAPLEDAPPPAKSERTPRPRRISSENKSTTADDFDALEADFFAREADLYKGETPETFDDLDSVAGQPGPRSPKK